MVKTIQLTENKPYPNNILPVLYYEQTLNNTLADDFTANDVLQLFENHGYTRGWIGGILDQHHFHSTAHEALAVIKGEVTVQLGGQDGPMHTLRKGDVVLLPADTAHKRLDGSKKFEIVGAHTVNGEDFDMQYGDASDYEAIKETILKVKQPLTDPATGNPGDINAYWSDEA